MPYFPLALCEGSACGLPRVHSSGMGTSKAIEKPLGSRSTAVMDGQPIAMDTAEQVHLSIEEAHLARAQAEEAVQRIQQRIERLVSLSGGNDGRERELASTIRRSD